MDRRGYAARMSAASHSPEDELLRVNGEFYRAFAAGDFVAMDGLWAEQAAVLCIHPGWAKLHGRDEVMASWRSILRRPMAIGARDEVAVCLGEVGVVVCVEVLADGELAATNVFVREAGGWRLMHHQAGPMARSDSAADTDGSGGRLLN